MDAFEKWRAEYGIAHPMYDRPNYRERFYASEAFRAGMRRAAEMCRDRSTILEPGNTTHTEQGGCYECGAEEEADYLATAILAEADK